MMRVALLSGGVGGARCALALDIWRRETRSRLDLTAIVNVGDDFTHLGLRISPDIDSVLYHLGDLGDTSRGWGRAGDSATIAEQLRRHLPEAAWFHLGDLDLGHSLIRTRLLAQGLTLSEVTAKFAEDFGIEASVRPVTDDPSPTVVDVPAEVPAETLWPDEASGTAERSLGFQEWWVRGRAEPMPCRFRSPAAAEARPAPGVLDAIRDADVVVIAPSNPIVSVTPVLDIPGVREAVRATSAPVVGLSPIIGGRPVRGWADRCLAVAGVECSATGVRDFYGARESGGLLDGWLLDPTDATPGPHPMPTTASELRFGGDERDTRIVEALWELVEALPR
ncbi:2-phospho-L-lactate transferase CofD family protein [Leucobacter allii]|uniref:2-phospho-L-lactate transferase CofD family protein n=1 Tax=Leucobacter allii TaxID=2932247 RepID=UPI001FD2077F|nr:2-phospho-L-lactate transferase CofD family protein [Leucobacter allii]UOR02181.1 2-phospho-L-lactate transferase CofD family protein [Leucobacter allii]